VGPMAEMVPVIQPEPALKQPAERVMPLLKEEVAEEESEMEPPVIVRPFDVARPPVPTERPPVHVEVAALVSLRIPPKVLVAVFDWKNEPPEIVTPLVDEIPPAPDDAIPPANVEVALLPTMVVVAVPPM